MSDEPTVVYRYTGDPDDPEAPFFAGVPKRNLTEADVAGLTARQVADIAADPPGGGKAAYVRTRTRTDVEPAELPTVPVPPPVEEAPEEATTPRRRGKE